MVLNNNFKTVGIVGGVGPEASNKFCELLIKYKNKKKDQDNIPFLHFSNPQIPDRTEAILGKGKSPTKEIIKTCNSLKKAGADFLIIPCNTAHYFLPDIQEKVSIPIVNMISLLVKQIKLENPNMQKIGVLATSGSMKSGIFEDYLGMVGIDVVKPSETEQNEYVMEAIYGKNGIKAGKKYLAKHLLTEAANSLILKGAEAVILGCTEIPLVLKQKDFYNRLYDPMDVSAKEIIKFVESKKDVVEVKYSLEVLR
jgi:aspartate racemase